jgi:hypothetical protein
VGEDEAGKTEATGQETGPDGGPDERANALTVPQAPGGEPRPCEWCQQPLPPPRNPRRGGRPQRYHQPGEGPGGQNCKALADAARKTATAAATAEPLAALRAFGERAATERAAFADRLGRHVADLQRLAELEKEESDRLAATVDAVTTRNSELERQAAEALAAADEATAARDSAERLRQAAVDARAEAERERDRSRTAAAEADTRARLAEELAQTHQLARKQAEQQARQAADDRAEARSERDAARERLADAERRLQQMRDELVQAQARLAEERSRVQALTQEAADHADRAREATARADAAERDTATVRDRLAEAVAAAETARTERAAAQAAREAEVAALTRDRDAARADADRQRERAVLAQQRAETAEALVPPAGRLPAVDATGPAALVRIGESAAVRAEGEEVVLDRLPTPLSAETALQVAYAILALKAPMS